MIVHGTDAFSQLLTWLEDGSAERELESRQRDSSALIPRALFVVVVIAAALISFFKCSRTHSSPTAEFVSGFAISSVSFLLLLVLRSEAEERSRGAKPRSEAKS